MLDQILNSQSLPLLEKMAAFAERRQEVLAGNIANIDTPEYKMRDLPVNDFQVALREAIQLKDT
ncbi:MAG: flagellar basal body protein [Gimesia sp.]|nr:flagellar basal body protein [Gimesia sp.]